jgi:putative ABC transport system permease protein
MAWRDARASRGRFAFVILAIAVGVAALSGVKGFNESVRYTLLAEARTLMAADIMVRLEGDPTAEELELIDDLRRRGMEVTRVTETVSMSTSDVEPTPLLSSIKAADLSEYPYYGELVLDPPLPDLAADSVAVSADLLLRLGVGVGDRVQVGAGEFRIGALSVSEPDRMTTGFTLGPRVLMSREGYRRAGLDVPGSRATERFLVRLPEGYAVDDARRDISSTFGRRARVTDYRESNRTLARGLDRATTFLSLVSLVALIVGGLGVATSIESHLRQKMDVIAMIKCVGGRNRQVIATFLLEALFLGLAGSVLGVALGFAVQAVFPFFLAEYFDVEVRLVFSFAPVVQGMLAGMLTALLFTIPPLLTVSRIRPALIFRRDMNEDRPRERDWRPYAASGLIVVGLWAMAVWVGDSWRVGSIFAVGLLGSVLILGVGGAAFLWVIRRTSRRFGGHWPPALRHGVANLYRPGAHMVATLAALAIGVMFTLTVQLVQTTLVEQLTTSAPPDMPNVYMINITDRESAGLEELIAGYDGVIDPGSLAPAVAGMLDSVRGVAIEDMRWGPGQRRYWRTQFQLTWSKEPPPATEILEGEWWAPGTTEALVSVEESAAGILDLSPGDEIAWEIGGRVTSARVANIRRTDQTRVGANNQFILTPGTLDEYPGIYYGALRVEPDAVGGLQRAVFEAYPSVTVVNAADIVDIVQEMVGRISLVVRFVAGFAILGGTIILASSIAGTRYRRIREAAILKTVGARRWLIIRIFSVEFLIIGLLAGTIGSLLAAAFSSYVVSEFLDGVYVVDAVPLVVAVVLTSLLTVITGWAASYRLLGQKPLEVLRRADS